MLLPAAPRLLLLLPLPLRRRRPQLPAHAGRARVLVRAGRLLR
jgi:hypothetical protein